MQCMRFIIALLFVFSIYPTISQPDDLQYKLIPNISNLTYKGQTQPLRFEAFQSSLAVADLTEDVELRSMDESIAVINESGHIQAVGNGETVIQVKHNGVIYEAYVLVEGCDEEHIISFANEIQPMLTKIGCNAGACHGAAAGKNGFKLSLRGYDHPTDYNVLTRQANGRRVSLAEPEQSLMLLKPSGQVPHGGGRLIGKDSLEYQTIKRWLEQGAPPPKPTDKKIERLQVYPEVLRLNLKDTQQIMVRAHYNDGSYKDVTRFVKFGTTDENVAVISNSGEVTVKGSGAAALTVWYDAKVAFARINVPFPEPVEEKVFAQAERFNFIDDAILAQLKALNVAPSKLAGDAEFLRRAFLDTIGLLPTQKDILQFLLDNSEDKRAKLVDRLLQRDEFIDYWSYKWSDLLLVSSRNLPRETLLSYYRFIRNAVEENKGWDDFAREIVMAKGSTLENGAGAFFLLHKETTDLTETVSQAFLGMSITCARCHNHPLEKWTQDEYYGMANLVSQVKLKNGNRPGETYVLNDDYSNILHPIRKKPMKPKPLDSEPISLDNPNRREYLAEWLTDTDNPYFARAIINRVWKNFMGRGIVEPVDDLRLTNPPLNEPLFAALEKDFIEHDYNIKYLIRTIMNSAAYQRSSKPHLGNEKENKLFSRYYMRRLPAEVILDIYSQVTDVHTPFPGYPAGWRALQLPDSQVSSYFLTTFGRPPRQLTCACERESVPTLTQTLHISNGDTLNDKLRKEGNVIDQYLDANMKLEEIIHDFYMKALTRFPSDKTINEIKNVTDEMGGWSSMDKESKNTLLQDILWALLSGKEFLFNH